MNTDTPIDPAEMLGIEHNEIAMVNGKGIPFTVTKTSPLRIFGPERTFFIRQPYLGTLDYLAEEYTAMHFSPEILVQNWQGESKRLTKAEARRCARIVAIAVLNSKTGIMLCGGLLTEYFLWHLTPERLFELSLMVNASSNIGDFIDAIRLLAATPRVTTPNLIAQKQATEALKASTVAGVQ